MTTSPPVPDWWQQAANNVAKLNQSRTESSHVLAEQAHGHLIERMFASVAASEFIDNFPSFAPLHGLS